MSKIERVILVVLDSVGVGELPDAVDYGDVGSNTLANTAEAVGGLNLPNLAGLGLGNVTDVKGVLPLTQPRACYGKMTERSAGKDTTTGHWEIAGIITERPFPTYPHGFPPEVVEPFESAIGRKILGNRTASGTEIIKELGEEHIRTGRPIVYTSADSVFQVACHEEVVPVEELYEWCRIARDILQPPHRVARVIARPFTGAPGDFKRTERRRDFSAPPTDRTILDAVQEAGGCVIAIGKIHDIFAERGIDESRPTANNAEGMQALIDAVIDGRGQLVFANLVDFDMLYGHRNDPAGYAKALGEFDSRLPELLDRLRSNDVLIITADHGCDPTTESTDHSREYVPVLAYTPGVWTGADLGTRACFCDIAATIARLLQVHGGFPGDSFADRLFGS